MPKPSPSPNAYRYFVDEAGDPNGFDRKKRIAAGEQVVSKCFLVGAALIYEPEQFGANALYDEIVSALFETRLHQAESTHVVFAARGKAARNVALADAIERARKVRAEVEVNTPFEVAGPQVIDYYLWALQRLLERGEPRFFNFIAPAYRLILDRDDTRERPYGEYYTSKRPLTPETRCPSHRLDLGFQGHTAWSRRSPR